jgi:hypothetical protein
MILPFETLWRKYLSAAVKMPLFYSYQEHVLQMAKIGIWGTEHEIVTAAHLLECSIICVSDYGGQMAMQQFAPHFPVECTEDCMHETILYSEQE